MRTPTGEPLMRTGDWQRKTSVAASSTSRPDRQTSSRSWGFDWGLQAGPHRTCAFARDTVERFGILAFRLLQQPGEEYMCALWRATLRLKNNVGINILD